MRHVFNIMLVAALGCSVAFAGASDKVAAASSTVLVTSGTITATTPPTCTTWANILSTSIKASGGKDLFIGFSAQTGLFTSGGVINTSNASETADIQVRVLVDSNSTADSPPVGNLAAPGALTFDSLVREVNQTASADSLYLVVNKGGAHSFNFTKDDVGNGGHTVNVQGRFCYQNAGAGSIVSAIIGPRTLTVEGVTLQ